MKRFLLFLVVAIAVVSLGLTIYYFSADNEVIRINNAYISLNKNQVLSTSQLLTIENQSEYTTIDYSGVGDETILEYSENDGWYTPLKGGKTDITIRTSNRHYSTIVIEVTVNDGSEEFPYAIYREADLLKIGNDAQYTTDACYRQHEDITLTKEWKPIEEFTGVYDGANHVIYDMKIQQPVSSEVGFVGKLGINKIDGHARENKQGVIKNLKLSNVNIEGEYHNVGAFAGINNGKIEVCSVLSGQMGSTAAGGNIFIGGIAGKNENTELKPIIDRCVYTGSILINTADIYAAGIAGANNGGQISESAFRGTPVGNDVNKTYIFAGITVENTHGAKDSADIYDSYAYITDGTKALAPDNIAGLVYENTAPTGKQNHIIGCYYGGTLQTEATSTAIVNGESGEEVVAYLSIEEFKLQPSFVSYTVQGVDGEVVFWNFENVWYMGEKYPEVSETSELGTVYLIDVSNIITNSTITSIEQLYNTLKQDSDNKVANSYEISFSEEQSNFEWKPIDTLYGNLIFKNSQTMIKNLTIKNETKDGHVGLFKYIEPSAIVTGFKVDSVKIVGEDGGYVGTIAGRNKGAHIQDITVNSVTCEIGGLGFGGLFGRADNVTGHGIRGVIVKNITTKKNFDYAGGMVGYNFGVISKADSGSITTYNNVQNINLAAKQMGGVAGYNQGVIEKTRVLYFNFTQTLESNPGLFGEDLYIGGIAGRSIKEGVINSVYVIKSKTVVPTGSGYNTFLGGIAGLNNGSIVRAYVSGCEISTKSNYAAMVGGIVGDNNGGTINLSVVEKTTKIITSTTFVLLNNTSTSGATLAFICSMTGGIAGCNRNSTKVSIYQSVSAAEVQGFYAGGIAGVTYGTIEKCSYGFVDGGKDFRENRASITGFYAGGIASLVSGGKIKNCYSICTITGATFTGTSADWSKVTLNTAAYQVCSQEVSAKAGFAVFIIGDAVVENCYTVAEFSGDGINFATTLTEVQRSDADRAKYNYGTLKNCAYQTYGNYNNGGTRLTSDQFKGVGNNYKEFLEVGFDATSVWDLRQGGGGYPRFYKIAAQLPQSPTAY